MKHRSALIAFSTILMLAFSAACGLAAESDVITEQMRTRMRAEFSQQIADTDAVLEKDPQLVQAYSARGDARLFLGDFRGAVADFEKMIALDPKQDAPHWRLGIAYYFAGDFAKSARQFEKYHAYDGRDRENGIWKFLAQAKADGIAKARTQMLAYTRFDREPFPSLYEMFARKKSPDDVLAEVEKKGLTTQAEVVFFANYYAGLIEDLLGNRARALELLAKAVASPAGRDARGGAGYMWQVARLHWERLRSEK
jgi:lipoprotein NlpI